jgi:hypothetical protein
MFLRLSRTNWILLGIAAIAAFFRFYRLDTLPPGFQFDQAFYVFDVLRLLQGQFNLFFAAPGGSEPLYLYLATVGVSIFGDSALGLKLTSAVIGVLTVPLVYDVTRTFFQTPRGTGVESDDRSPRIALLAALFAAISLWHIFFTRYGERVTLLVLLEILVFKFLWRALLPADISHQSERARWRDFALAGLFTALGLYTYVGSRTIPFALILLTAYAMLTDRARARIYFKGLLLATAVIVIVFLPLGLYFVSHPDQFFSHSADVSIFVPHGNVPSGAGPALLNNAMRLLGMFFIAGDGGNLRNVPGRPIFDPLMGSLFVIGVLALLVALVSRQARLMERRRAVFLLTWMGASLAISLFTDDAPNFVRTLPAMPAVMMLPAWGAVELWKHWRNQNVRQIAAAGVGLVVVISAGLAYRDYFIVLAQDPATYYTFDTDKVETSDWINRNAISQHLFLAPLWAQNGTISLLTRNAPLKSFESRDTIILPGRAAGKDAVYGFPPEQDRKVQTMASRLGGLGAVEHLTGSNGGELLLIYRVPAGNLPDLTNPLGALSRGGAFVQPQQLSGLTWANRIELLGSSLSPEGPGGRNLTVNLFLRALSSMDEDYTFSIKVRDEKGRVWGQEDKWPGDNSYATTQWSAGDLVIEKFYPGLNACAPAAEYTVGVETYNPKTMQVLALGNNAGSSIPLGRFTAGASESNRLVDLDPEQVLETQVGPQLELMGYTLSADQLHAGEEFSLALFWRGKRETSTQKIEVRLRDQNSQDFVLGERTINVPTEGRGVCSLLDLHLPPGVSMGTGTIWVNDSKIATITLVQ